MRSENIRPGRQWRHGSSIQASSGAVTFIDALHDRERRTDGSLYAIKCDYVLRVPQSEHFMMLHNFCIDFVNVFRDVQAAMCNCVNLS